MRYTVARLKQEMAVLHSSGRAERLCGIIVTPEVYRALEEDSENFRGKLGISGMIGSRVVRFEFYALANPNFPTRSNGSHFFVPYPEEVYRKRFLGKEDEILAGERRVTEVSWVRIEQLNPISGIVLVGNNYLYDVSFEEVVSRAQEAAEAGRDILRGALELRWGLTNHNPPQAVWVKRPSLYDFGRADIQASIGNLIMKREVVDGKNGFVIVGIAVNGLGNIVEIMMPESIKCSAKEFALFAHHYFVDEEVVDFMAGLGIEVRIDELKADPVSEDWRIWDDQEELGRLKNFVSLGTSETYSFAASFKSTRIPCCSLDLLKGLSAEEKEQIKEKHFPSDWQGWEKTSAHRALEAAAANL